MSNFIDYLRAQVKGGAIYVWGARGQLLTEMKNPEEWIRKREHKMLNAERAIKTYRMRVEQGYTEIRAYDCSGLIMYFLKNLKEVYHYDMGTQGLYELCKKYDSASMLKRGDLVFKGGAEKTITHVGVYVSADEVIEAMGRDVGVVSLPFRDGGWKYFGHLETIEPFLYNNDETILALLPSTKMRGESIKHLQILLNLVGYKDAKGRTLDEDSILGPSTWEAFSSFIAAHKELVEHQ